MTSNIGSSHLLEGIGADGTLLESARSRVIEDLRAHFRPEFLNRVDETVVFLPLRRDQVGVIVEIQLRRVRRRLEERHIALTSTAEAINYIADAGYDPVYGARPLKRYIQQYVETPLARDLIAGKIHDGEEVVIDVQGDNLAFNVTRDGVKQNLHPEEQASADDEGDGGEKAIE